MRSADGTDLLVVCRATVLADTGRLRDLLPIVTRAAVLVEGLAVLDGAEEARRNGRRTIRHGQLVERLSLLLWDRANLKKSRFQMVKHIDFIVTYLVKFAQIKEFVERDRILHLVEYDECVRIYRGLWHGLNHVLSDQFVDSLRWHTDRPINLTNLWRYPSHERPIGVGEFHDEHERPRRSLLGLHHVTLATTRHHLLLLIHLLLLHGLLTISYRHYIEVCVLAAII